MNDVGKGMNKDLFKMFFKDRSEYDFFACMLVSNIIDRESSEMQKALARKNQTKAR